jgi:hypothetical protein
MTNPKDSIDSVLGVLIELLFAMRNPCFGLCTKFQIINGNFGILKWRYCNGYIRPYFVGIFPYIALKKRPYIW